MSQPTENDLSEHSVSAWIVALKQGEDEAADKIWHRFYTDLVRLAARRLQSSHSRAADADDVVQNAFHSFFRRAAAGKFPDLNDRHELWSLLVTMTERKALNELRASHAQKRGGGRTRNESVFFTAVEDGGGIDWCAGSNPTPDDAAMVAESFDRLIAALAPEQRLIAVYKLEGRTNEEISRLLDCAVSTIERRLQMIRKKWSQMIE